MIQGDVTFINGEQYVYDENDGELCLALSNARLLCTMMKGHECDHFATGPNNAPPGVTDREHLWVILDRW